MKVLGGSRCRRLQSEPPNYHHLRRRRIYFQILSPLWKTVMVSLPKPPRSERLDNIEVSCGPHGQNIFHSNFVTAFLPATMGSVFEPEGPGWAMSRSTVHCSENSTVRRKKNPRRRQSWTTAEGSWGKKMQGCFGKYVVTWLQRRSSDVMQQETRVVELLHKLPRGVWASALPVKL